MKHRAGYNRLSRTDTHRKAMIRNMMTSLLRYERIVTTKAKALEVRRHVEKLITRAKVDSVHNRRVAAEDIKDKEILNKLFTDIGLRNSDRPGGYTRILKLGRRYGDSADMAILELVELPEEEQSEAKKKKGKKAKKTAEEKGEPQGKEEETSEEAKDTTST